MDEKNLKHIVIENYWMYVRWSSSAVPLGKVTDVLSSNIFGLPTESHLYGPVWMWSDCLAFLQFCRNATCFKYRICLKGLFIIQSFILYNLINVGICPEPIRGKHEVYAGMNECNQNKDHLSLMVSQGQPKSTKYHPGQ